MEINKIYKYFTASSFIECFSEYCNTKKIDHHVLLKKAQNIYDVSQKYNKVLLLGKIQSGKTTAFCSVIATFFDKGYDLVIILAGLDNTLKDQTSERMHEVFADNNLLKVKIMNYTQLKNKLKHQKRNVIEDFNHNLKLIIPILKNKTHLKNIYECLEDPIFKNKKILIVDDEADLASLDDQKSKTNRTINEGIIKILKASQNNFYLSVTATPYANIIANSNEELLPQAIFTIEPGPNYCGNQKFLDYKQNVFHIIEDDKETDCEIAVSDYIIRIILLSYINEVYFKQIKKTLAADLSPLLTTTMIIHTSPLTNEHKEVSLKIEAHRRFISSLSVDQTVYLKQFKDLFETCKSDAIALSDDSELKNVITNIKWNDDILILIKRISEMLEINVINATKIASEKIVTGKFNIIIGSKKIERGVTFLNLLVTFITNYKKNTASDTNLQRSRWFGYREKSFIWTKVYLKKQSLLNLENILLTDEDIWTRAIKAEENKNFSEFGNYLKQYGDSPLTHKVKYTIDRLDNVAYYIDKININASLREQINSFYDQFISQQNWLYKTIKVKELKYKMFDNLSILNFIKENGSVFDAPYHAFINAIDNNFNKYQKIIVFDLNNNQKLFRTPKDDQSYQLFSGRSKDFKQKDSYVGDRYLFEYKEFSNSIIILLQQITDITTSDTKKYVSIIFHDKNSDTDYSIVGSNENKF